MDKSKNTNEYVAVYKALLEKGEIQIAYERLIKCVMMLKTHFANNHSDEYNVGNVSPGYMDFTYFPFFNDFLRARKLRFGIVLNHQQMHFELWLMGQNAEVQKEYWNLLKSSHWNKGRDVMPKYSVLEVVLVDMPNFDDQEGLSAEIEKIAISLCNGILDTVRKSEEL